MYHDRANDWATITADLPPRENSTPSLTLEGSPCKQNRPRTVLHGRFGERLLTSDESPLGEATATTDSSGESASFRSAVCGSSDFDGHFGRGHLPFELPSLCFSPCQRFRNGESRPALGWSFFSTNLYVIWYIIMQKAIKSTPFFICHPYAGYLYCRRGIQSGAAMEPSV